MYPRSFLVLLGALAAGCTIGPTPSPAELARFEAASRDLCAVAGPLDFEGAGEADLRRYLQALARTRGSPVGIGPQQVDLAVSRGDPKSGPVGVTAGEVACEPGNGAFRITLYRDALVGRQLHTAYRTVAHEFQHVVQIRRDGLRCGPRSDADAARYEREAASVAAEMVPECGASASAGAASAGR